MVDGIVCATIVHLFCPLFGPTPVTDLFPSMVQALDRLRSDRVVHTFRRHTRDLVDQKGQLCTVCIYTDHIDSCRSAARDDLSGNVWVDIVCNRFVLADEDRFVWLFGM